MTWIRPKNCSRNKLDIAGKILAKDIVLKDSSRKKELNKIFQNWRASHAYPMHIIMMTLKNISKSIETDAICVQRLKREPSVIGKLKRYTTTLSQIQDIAGCRVVVSNVDNARKIADKYISSKQKHKRIKKREKNYINNPKKDGYRSIHLVYKYYSKNEGNVSKHNGQMVEIQIRSQLQHIWATAVETVDLFESQKMKFGQGDIQWRRFFILMSAFFAKIEHCPPVENTPIKKNELYKEIINLEKELNVLERLEGWAESINYLDTKESERFILVLDTDKKHIEVIPQKKEESFENFIKKYSLIEQKYSEDLSHDVVWIVADNVSDLNKAYPNYFADTKEFLLYLKKIKEEFILLQK